MYICTKRIHSFRHTDTDLCTKFTKSNTASLHLAGIAMSRSTEKHQHAHSVTSYRIKPPLALCVISTWNPHNAENDAVLSATIPTMTSQIYMSVVANGKMKSILPEVQLPSDQRWVPWVVGQDSVRRMTGAAAGSSELSGSLGRQLPPDERSLASAKTPQLDRVKYSFVSQIIHNRSLWRRVFPGDWLHWYCQVKID